VVVPLRSFRQSRGIRKIILQARSAPDGVPAPRLTSSEEEHYSFNLGLSTDNALSLNRNSYQFTSVEFGGKTFTITNRVSTRSIEMEEPTTSPLQRSASSSDRLRGNRPRRTFRLSIACLRCQRRKIRVSPVLSLLLYF